MAHEADNTFENHAKIVFGMAAQDIIKSLDKDVKRRMSMAIAKAYMRGVAWARENPESEERAANDPDGFDYAVKAAHDYADKTVGE